jgi:hypothetical protein
MQLACGKPLTLLTNPNRKEFSMTINHNNAKYKAVFQGIPFEARQADQMRRKRESLMGSPKVRLRPVYRDPPDLERIGRALLEMVLLSKTGDQKSAENQEELRHN